jgi:hypothetical protein
MQAVTLSSLVRAWHDSPRCAVPPLYQGLLLGGVTNLIVAYCPYVVGRGSGDIVEIVGSGWAVRCGHRVPATPIPVFYVEAARIAC